MLFCFLLYNFHCHNIVEKEERRVACCLFFGKFDRSFSDNGIVWKEGKRRSGCDCIAKFTSNGKMVFLC